MVQNPSHATVPSESSRIGEKYLVFTVSWLQFSNIYLSEANHVEKLKHLNIYVKYKSFLFGPVAKLKKCFQIRHYVHTSEKNRK